MVDVIVLGTQECKDNRTVYSRWVTILNVRNRRIYESERDISIKSSLRVQNDVEFVSLMWIPDVLLTCISRVGDENVSF